MRRQIAAALCAAAFGAIAVSSSSFAIAQRKAAKACVEPARCGVSSNKAPGDRPVHTTVKDLMDSIIDPSADAVWGAAGTVIDKQGVQDMSPKTQEEWLNVRRAAVRIVEGANLLMMPDREAAPAGAKSEAPGVELEPPEITALIKKKRKSFDAFARAFQALGLEAMRASEAKDVPLLDDIGARMEGVCESCHQTFWYPLDQQASTRN
jgi:hypothetical protein